MKGQHFEFNEQPQRPEHMYTSISKASYDFKGDPNKCKSTVDAALKEDLIRNHFDIGGSANIA